MTITSPPLVAPPDRITVVTAPACDFCRDALDALDDIGRDFPLQIVELDVRNADGLALMQRHRAGMSPLVLLDDVFVSAGRLPRNKLRTLLAARAGQAAVAR